ncbi:MAG: 50S ribosomal protein L31e [Candidatus Methanospirare jalkutatii]|nr:50S ribosomal protein L31e [Candidatus Methanospirare jalkutatii]
MAGRSRGGESDEKAEAREGEEGEGEAEALEERIYTIPLRDAKKVARWKRSKRAVEEVRKFLRRHTKASVIVIDPALNEKIWERGAEKPPSRIRVRAKMLEDGVVKAELIE